MLIEQFLVHFYSFTVLFIYSVGFKGNIEPFKIQRIDFFQSERKENKKISMAKPKVAELINK